MYLIRGGGGGHMSLYHLPGKENLLNHCLSHLMFIPFPNDLNPNRYYRAFININITIHLCAKYFSRTPQAVWGGGGGGARL